MATDHEDGVAPPSNDAYTGMLSISLLALIGACVLLYLDYSRYPDANPPPLQKLAPDKKVSETIQAKAEFQVVPEAADLAPGMRKTFNVRNGKIDSAESNHKGVTTMVKETSFEVIVDETAAEMEYTITVKSKDDKTATLKVTVKKE